MNILIRKYIENDEMLVSVHLKDDKNTDIDIYPFYVNSEIDNADPAIRQSLDKLSYILQKVYNTGKNNESFNIEQEIVQL